MTNDTAAAPLLRATEVKAQAHGFLAVTGAWITTHWLQLLIACAIGAAIVLALNAARGVARRLCAREGDPVAWRAVIGRTLVRTNNFFIVMLAAKLVGDTFAAAAPPKEVADTIGFLWTVAAVFQVAVWARELILGAVEHRTSADNGHGEALTSAVNLIRLLVTVALFAIAAVVVLDNVGVNVTGLVAGLGVGGIAIGLAAQGIFADLFAALAIIFDRPFRRGDAISYDQTNGTVEEIGLKSTRVRGVDGELRVIANKTLLDKEIRNNSRRERHHTRWTLGLACETPPDLLARVPDMLRALVEAEGARFVRAGLTGFGPYSLPVDLEFDSPSGDYAEAFAQRHRIALAVLQRFREEGVTMPFPIQTTYTAAPDGTLVMPYAGAPAAAPA